MLKEDSGGITLKIVNQSLCTFCMGPANSLPLASESIPHPVPPGSATTKAKTMASVHIPPSRSLSSHDSAQNEADLITAAILDCPRMPAKTEVSQGFTPSVLPCNCSLGPELSMQECVLG